MTSGRQPAERILLGPGPSNVPDRIRRAMSRPLLGHLDPDFLAIMNRIQDLLRSTFRTRNRMTVPISGTGSAGMECAITNFVEPGDEVVVGIHGVFGGRIAECARRAGGKVTEVQSPFGQALQVQQLAEAARQVSPKIVAVVHAETSTGVIQPLEDLAGICRQSDALLLVDAVTSLGGQPLEVDGWGIDICYSGTQKCLNCPPGLAPLTVSERAMERLRSRATPVNSWYLDLKLLGNYWGQERSYHHTAPISMNFALLEALEVLHEEGLEERWQRHRLNHLRLAAGIQAMGLEMLVAAEHRLWPLNTIAIPSKIDDAEVRRVLLNDFNLEIGGGLGSLQGRVWRVGLMGVNSDPRQVFFFLHALEDCLRRQGYECPAGIGLQAASALEHLSPRHVSARTSRHKMAPKTK